MHCLSFIILPVASDLTVAECPWLVLSSSGAEGLSNDLIHAKTVEKASKMFFLPCCSIGIHCATQPFFFFIFAKIIAVITVNRNVEYGPLNICYKMLFFFFLCLFFFIKLKACLMGEMCSNVRGQWEDRVRQEGLKVIAWSARAKSPLIFKARYKSGFFFCFSPN